MKITVVGSHLSCHAALQTYLHIRETSDLYAEIRGTQRLGVPCFI